VTSSATGPSARPPVRFGAQLRHARETNRLSLGDLAERCGVTASFLSRVERDETSPSVASLVAICDALGLPIAELFTVPQTTLVRRDDRALLAQLPSSDEVIDTLITPAWERHLTVLETVAGPGGSGGEALYTMPSQTEVCFVLEGSVEVVVGDERVTLEEGDALTFGAASAHTWRNAGGRRGARILWILAPGIPDPQGEATATRR
jgi:transcriptional regulator with XRE-family HTH domain